jgi:hypothetical protein
MQRAQSRAGEEDFLGAWQDLNQAERLLDVAQFSSPPHLVRQRQLLLELAIESAEQHLMAGRPVQAQRIVADLKRQRILDSRADQIESLAQRIHLADVAAGQGRWSAAQQTLDRIIAQRPDLAWVQARRQALVQQSATAGGLAHKLRSAIQASQWTAARQVSAQLLDIAPHCQVAADALRRSCERQQTPAAPHPEQYSGLSDTSPGKLSDTDVNLSRNAEQRLMNRAMLWVDGVGGYLLCLDPQVTIGRALPDAGVDIPILGDLHRRHLRIARSGNDFLATNLAATTCDGRPLADRHLLKHGQQLSLGSAVVVKLTVPHRYSATARLDLVSRHRTQPWSDAVILVADTIILGPGSTSHIVVPHLDQEVVLCRRENGWTIRSSGNIEVDGEVRRNQAELASRGRIVGDGFSMTLETA